MAGTYVGFGFGAIQGGVFLPHARASGRFDRLVVAEIDSSVVEGVRAGGGSYCCNVAHADRVEFVTVDGVEVLDPTNADDREVLVSALSEAGEIGTAIPSFLSYDAEPAPVARLLAEGLTRKSKRPELPPAVVYAAENDVRAAARLEALVWDHAPAGFGDKVVFSETVIPKMCTVVTDPDRIEREELVPTFKGASRALLVEAYDQILIEEHVPAGFVRGLDRFHPKRSLDCFAQTKLFGHNGLHAWLGYVAESQGLTLMSEVGERHDLIRRAAQAFSDEIQPGLLEAFASTRDPLFTCDGMEDYLRNALQRMTNPFLNDPIARITRDPLRKLGWEDRLIGGMRLALQAGVEPKILSEGARLALERAVSQSGGNARTTLLACWGKEASDKEAKPLLSLLID